MEALKLQNNQNTNYKSSKSTSERVKETQTAEIVIGICSQIGSKKPLVMKAIEDIIKEYGYQIKIIKLSDIISASITQDEFQPNKTEGFSKLFQKITAGNDLRKTYGEDYLANVAISQIANMKKVTFSVTGEENFSKIKSQRICYIIDSIKHTEELNTFRDVYRDIFYLMSIYTPKEERLENIASNNLSRDEASELLDIDQYEKDKYGQQVREVFVNADFFLRVDNNTENDVSKKVNRYINLIFGNDIETPTIDVRAMYEAKSAAVNSACLSRQVGASIMCKDGNLLSTGWNDVPKFGGNLYTSDCNIDNRCFVIGHCHNDSNKTSLVKYILDDFDSSLDINTILPDNKEFSDIESLYIKEKLSTFIKKTLENSGIKSLIEFSRSVHAEMHAIINAGHINGEKIKGGTLYCTTYPCHNCARHIIAAGIKKVYYIEPYTKSKAPELHNDSITENEKINDKVQLLVFDGVSPRRYLTFFNQNRDRKKRGISLARNQDKTKLNPINNISLQALFYLETQAAQRITDRQTNG